jgi:hypothetical protein
VGEIAARRGRREQIRASLLRNGTPAPDAHEFFRRNVEDCRRKPLI